MVNKDHSLKDNSMINSSIKENKMDPSVILNLKSDQNQTFPLNHEKVINRTSTRPRKTPLMKSDDFLW